MKKLLAVLLLLVPSVALAQPGPLSLALRLEHVWTEQVDDWDYDDQDATDVEGSVVPSIAIGPQWSLFGRGTYKFEAARSEWGLGIEWRFGECPKPCPKPAPTIPCKRRHR